MRNAKRLLVNTAVLTFASILMQTVGVFFNVYLTNRLGSSGIGLFSLIMTVYSLCCTLGSGGVRLASTRLTVESDAMGTNKKYVLRRCVLYSLGTGLLFCAVLYFSSGLISRLWLEDMRCVRPLKILSLCLPFVAMSNALNGYFTAERKIFKYSAVRILEQGVRILTVAAILTKFLEKGLENGCVAVVTGTLVSEVFSFTLLFILWRIECFRTKSVRAPIAGKLLRIALPDVIGSGLRSILLTIEHILIPIGFRRSGSSAENALSVYGNIHGKVFPLLLYPSAVFSSLSGLLVPEIAEYNSHGRKDRISSVINRILKLTLIYSFFTAGVMFAFAEGLSFVIYNNDESVLYMSILAPLVPVMYCDMTVDGMLKGLDQQFHSMLYNIFDSGLCVVLVYFLLPRYSVKGYIFILFASEIINFYLSLRRLIKVSEVRINPIKDIFVPVACSICSVTSGKLLLGILCPVNFSVLPVAVCIISALAVYAIMLFTFGSLTKEEVEWAKGIVIR